MSDFVHLRLHTEYSLCDGTVRIPALLKAAQQAAMPAVAVSDLMNMFGLVKFYTKALAAGVKPIIASDMRIAEGDHVYQFSAYAINQEGYKNIRELLSRAYQENQILGQAYVKREWLAQHNEGLLILSGAKYGDIGQAIVLDKLAEAERFLSFWMELFPQRFYIELQRTGRVNDERYLHGAVALAEQYQCPVVATNDVRFLTAQEFEAHEARVCIYESRTLNDPRRERLYSETQYFKTTQEMQVLFEDIPEAISNTLEIARRCSVQIELGKYYLPEYPIPQGMTLESFFQSLCEDGLRKRFAKGILLNDKDEHRQEKNYWERLTFEINIIQQMGFPGYFLIVMDFIAWAREKNIPVGPGRGSGAGSLVAYCLGITDLDPLQYDLLFERFLNPERISMPDFDVDFCQERRDEVIQYVADTYGKNAVSQIITFGTMAAKAVVRDVARVQGKPYGLADRLSKMIPFAVGMTLEKAYESEEVIRQFLEEDGEAQGIWDMAVQLEGVARNVGKHAAGLVISPSKLSDFTPVYRVEGEDVLVSQYDKDDVEAVGLVKFDFLGLKNLTVIQWAVETINARLQKEQQPLVDITQIPLDDELSFSLLQAAQTTAVFQLESSGMKDLIKRLQPSSFEDIIALVALYRPGPLESGMVDDFINRKHGRQEMAFPHPQFQHDCLIPILKPTYGIILYQEQVMQIAQEMGGYSLGSADMLRRAMGKKKAEEMAKQREQFVAGSIEQGFDKELASNIFDLMEKFAGYGFNKSHSAAYALIAYQTAWLKARYPSAFMAAVMSADLQNTDKIVTLIEECRSMNLDVLPPDINQGQYLFTIDDQNRIIYGLGAIKGLGEGPVECLIEEREATGEYKHLFDLCARTDSRKVNKRALEAIVRSGAMDALNEPRHILMASLSDAMQAAEQQANNTDAGMLDMFGTVVSSSLNEDVYEHVRNSETWTLKEKLRGEKETLGLYLTGHPIDVYEQELQYLSSVRLGQLKVSDKQRIIGLVISVRSIKTKRGASMAIITLDDRSGRVEFAVFSEMLERYRHLLKIDELIVVEGAVSEDSYTEGFKVNVKDIYSIEQMRLQRLKSIRLTLNKEQWASRQFSLQLQSILKPYTVSVPLGEEASGQKPDACRLLLNCQLDDLSADMIFGERWYIRPHDDVFLALRRKFGEDSINLIYANK